MRVTQALCRTRAALAEKQQLQEWFTQTRGPVARNQKSATVHDRHRRDIFSEELCHEALTALRLSNGLPRRDACDIIQVNPGFARWTTMLHDTIRPRRDILVEPEWSVYKDVLDPLLHRKDSRYRAAPTLEKALDPSSGVMSSELLRSIKDLTIEQRHSENRQLIIVANLVRKKLFSPTFVGSFAKLFLDQVYRATLEDTGLVKFHQHGLVKFLLWVDEEDRTSFLNTSAAQRSRLVRRLEAAYHIRAIVSTEQSYETSQKRPWYGVSVQSRDDVQTRDKLSKVLPKSRRPPLPKPETDVIPPIPENLDFLRSLPSKPRLVDRFLDMYDSLQKSNPEALAIAMSGYALKTTSMWESAHMYRTIPEVKEFRKLLFRLRVAHNHYTRVDNLAQRQIKLEKELLHLRKDNPDDQTSYFARLEEMKPEFRSIIAAYNVFFKDDKHSYVKALDDYRLLLHKSAPWFARDFEPVFCRPDDFFPEKPMALLEFTPKVSFVERVNSGDKLISFDYVNSISMDFPTSNVDHLIASLVGSKDSDAYNEFLDKLPSLTDPLHGGYWDLSQVRCRTLSAEQIIDIALVYEAWPYRKDPTEMLADVHRSFVRKRG